jgi:hypothetical protein
MHVWDEIAKRHVSSDDPEEIDKFWVEGLAALSDEEAQAIFEELLSREGEQPPEDWQPSPRKYAQGHLIPKLSDLEEL